MFVKKIGDCDEFTANDGCRIRELIHPERDPVSLPYSIAFASVETGKHSYRHRLNQTEVYYILNGQGCMHIDEEYRPVSEGDGIVIPAHAVQWIENTGGITLRFMAIVSPPWREEDDERLE